ncbi:MAG: hypothetical protein HUU17_04900 [Chthonomonadales bacterium]|nr:hypothetical protein [Chthonomonadales bacterium]
MMFLSPNQPDSSNRPVRSAIPSVALIAYMVFWQIAPRIREERLWLVLLSTVLSLALSVWVAAAVAARLQRVQSALILTLGCAALVIPLRIMFAAGRLVTPWVWMIRVPGLNELVFMLFGVGAGVLLSRIVRSLNMIPPIAVVLALVDIWTVLLGGPVQRVLSNPTPAAEKLAEAMTVRLPSSTAGAAPMAVAGFADFLFIAFFVSSLCRYIGMNDGYNRTLLPLMLTLCAYMLVVMVTGWALPALAPMAVVVLAVHRSAFHYSKEERNALGYAAGLILILIVLGFALR